MNTFAWTAWMLLAMSIAVLTYNPVYHTLLLLTLVYTSINRKIPFMRILQAGVCFGIPLFLINILFVHHGENTIFEIPSKITLIGYVLSLSAIAGPVTVESVSAAAIFMLILVNMLLIFSVYNNVTTPDNILRLIPKRLSHSTLLVAITMRFIPTITTDARSISETQRCRGLKTSNGSYTSRIKNNFALIIPTIINSLERSYNLAEALESRGYSKDRTRYFSEEWSIKDKVLTGLFLLGVVYLIFLRLSGSLSYWTGMTPYTGALQVNVLVVLSILALAIP